MDVEFNEINSLKGVSTGKKLIIQRSFSSVFPTRDMAIGKSTILFVELVQAERALSEEENAKNGSALAVKAFMGIQRIPI